MHKSYKHILVPVDGSKLAETALMEACDIAELSQAQITLLQVVSPIERVTAVSMSAPYYVEQQIKDQTNLAWKYLYNLYERVKLDKQYMRTAVEVGLAAETIIDYAQQNDVDLIVMATHGRSGVSRWVYGSVANKVLQKAQVPVLLVRTQLEPEMVA